MPYALMFSTFYLVMNVLANQFFSFKIVHEEGKGGKPHESKLTC